jgi:hypothetical protein
VPAPLAVILAHAPIQMVALVAVIVGNALTVTLAISVAVTPLPSVTVTV